MNLIIGAAVGYDFENLSPFILSLKKTGYTGDIYFLVDKTIDEWLEKKLKSFNINCIKIKTTFPFLPLSLQNKIYSPKLKLVHKIFPFLGSVFGYGAVKKIMLRGKLSSMFLSVACSRYYYYCKFLLENKDKYSKVLITDVRDVIFQENPFTHVTENQIIFALEFVKCKLGNEPNNYRWLKNMYSQKELENILNETVSCSGTTIGSTDQIIDYLLMMIEETASKLHLIAGEYGYDQGIHNYLVHTHSIPGSRFNTNNKGIILTMLTNPTEDFNFGNDGVLRNNDGSTISIVHQYDWFPEIKTKILMAIGNE